MRLPLLVFASTVLAFLPALRGGFVNWDDTAAFVTNPFFRGLSPDHLAWMFTTGLLGHYQPLAWVTYAVDHALWGLDPFGYHLTSLLLHALNAALLYRVALLLYEKAGTPEARRPAAAALAALLFALHPLRVESVAWATERRDVLSGTFLLLAAWGYIRHAEKKEGAYAASFAAFACALLSKITAAAWPFALLALDFYPLKRRAWKDKAGYLVLVALILPLALKAQRATGSLVTLGQSGLDWRAAQALFSVGFYPWKSLAPAGLSAWYEAPYLAEHAWVLGLGAALLAATVLAPWVKPRPPAALLSAWLFYLLMLFPMSGVVKSGGQLVADRYSYAPLMGAAVLLGAWAAKRRATTLAAALILPALAALTWAQCGTWKDSVSLWRRAEKVNPTSFFAAANAAQGLQDQGRYEESLAALAEVLRRHPGQPQGRVVLGVAENNTGLWLIDQGKTDEALPHLRRACELLPENDSFWVNLGIAHKLVGQAKEARAAYAKALEVNPANPQAAALLSRLGRR